MTFPSLRMSSLKPIGATIRDVLLGVFGIASIFIAILLTLADKLQAAGILFTAGILLSLFSSLTRFKLIKGLGIEAQMAELDSKLNEADKLLKHIREIVSLSADVSFQVMGRMGYWDASVPKKTALEIADSFRKQLRSLGAEDKEIEQHMMPWHAANLREILRPNHDQVIEYIQLQIQVNTKETYYIPHDAPLDDPRRLANNEKATWNTALLQPVVALWEEDVFAYASSIQKMIVDSRCGSYDDKQQLLSKLAYTLADAQYYAKHFDFRDREAWLRTPML
jgi:hypothetical protein